MNGLILDSLVADIEPIGEIFSDFFFMELHFLPDVKFLSKFDKNAINGIEIVTVVAPGGCKVQNC